MAIPHPREGARSSAAVASDQAVARPLYVDMDGTLLATDALWEMLVRLLKKSPALWWRVPLWLMGGKAYFKQRLGAHVVLNPAALPYRQSVVTLVNEEFQRGRQVVLATAADEQIAERVARHVGVFSAVLASDGAVNLSGHAKLRAIRQHSAGAPFDYVGDSAADLEIWRHAAVATVVAPSRGLLARARRTARSVVALDSTPNSFRALARMLRIHQWSKNLLLLLPLLLAHRILDAERAVSALLAFVAFSLSASAVYILNDLLDLESDRQHPYKRLRPLAAGEVPIPLAVAVLPLAVTAGLAVSLAFLPGLFAAILVLYLVMTTAYSLALKRVAIVDVLVLAGLYTLRVIAGAVAAQVPASPWFLAFSMFFFLSLAFVKRYAELRLPAAAGKVEHLRGRGYLLADADLLRSVGPTSGYMAVAVLALYINSPEVVTLYSRPEALWLIGPLLLYWVTRIWLLADRGNLYGDPVVFALTDRVSFVLAGLVAVILLLGAVA